MAPILGVSSVPIAAHNQQQVAPLLTPTRRRNLPENPNMSQLHLHNLPGTSLARLNRLLSQFIRKTRRIMSPRHRVLPGFLLCAWGLWQPAAAELVVMPAGSSAWMKLESNVCPDVDRDACVGSNLAGPTPAGGIGLSTFFETTPGRTGSVTGFAEILPDRIRTFASSRSTTFLRASFEDRYTVGGTVAGPFDVTVELHATGKMRSLPESFGALHQLHQTVVEIEIGTFNTAGLVSGLPLLEQFRVTAFAPTSRNAAGFGFERSAAPIEHDIDITTSFTRTGVQVGDIFDIAYGVNSTFFFGEIDLRDTATISFTLPAGVSLSSRLGGQFGVTPVPEPETYAMLLAGLGLMVLITRRRKPRDPSA